jgi:hypothetical protein
MLFVNLESEGAADEDSRGEEEKGGEVTDDEYQTPDGTGVVSASEDPDSESDDDAPLVRGEYLLLSHSQNKYNTLSQVSR